MKKAPLSPAQTKAIAQEGDDEPAVVQSDVDAE